MKGCTAAADQTSWGGNIRYVESNAISSFLVERLPHEDLGRKELWRHQHKQQLGVFVGKKADYSLQIHIRTWLGAEFSSNIVHVRDGHRIDFRIDSCLLFDAAPVCFSHPSSMFSGVVLHNIGRDSEVSLSATLMEAQG